MEKNFYKYKGPVCEWGKCITNSYEASTMATSKEKAISNIIFRFKKRTGRAAYSNITLPGNLLEFKKGGNYGGSKDAKVS